MGQRTQLIADNFKRFYNCWEEIMTVFAFHGILGILRDGTKMIEFYGIFQKIKDMYDHCTWKVIFD